uniref:Uncharacterized protein n=1 Tax=Anguilla anguilla TaxID=7936 RepID=A0A0E9VN25_ANGAN
MRCSAPFFPDKGTSLAAVRIAQAHLSTSESRKINKERKTCRETQCLGGRSLGIL